MSRIQCEYCNKTVSLANLRKHQRSGKCLEHQGVHAKMTHECAWCGEGFLRVDSLSRHSKVCKRRDRVVALSIEDRLREEISQLKVENESQRIELEEANALVTEAGHAMNLLRKEISVLKASPPIVNHITNNIRVDKFVVQQYAKDNFSALTDGVLKQCLSVAVDPRLLLRGPEAVAQLILETSLEGRDKVACTDTSRAVCFWKDIDHTVITDMKMRKLLPRLVRPIHNAYNAAWRKDDSMCGDQYRKVGDVIHRLNMIAQKRDTKSKYYNALSRIIMDAKCDLLYMLTEEDEQERDEDGNTIEWMSSDSE